MALLSRVPIEKAQGLGFQNWKLILSNWRNLGTGVEAIGLAYNVSIPIIGAQIAPESIVGECEIRQNLEASFPSLDLDGDWNEDSLYLRRGQPYLWRTPARLTIKPTFSTRWGDVRYRAQDADPAWTPASVGDFGQALAAAEFVQPELRLVLFFDTNPFPVASPSEPYEPRAVQRVLAIDDAVEHLVKFIPVQYRDRLRLVFENLSDTDDISVRLTGIRGGYSRIGFPAPVSHLREFDLSASDSPVAVPANSRISVLVSNPEILYLGVYATKAANTASSNFQFTLYAD